MDSDKKSSNKIVWKRSAKKSPTANVATVPVKKVSDTPVMDISSRAAVHNGNKAAVEAKEDINSEINSLKDEIAAALGGATVPVAAGLKGITDANDDVIVDLDATDQEILMGSSEDKEPSGDLPRTEKANPISAREVSELSQETLKSTESSTLDGVARGNHAALVASIKDDIQNDLAPTVEDSKETGLPKNTGIEQTYYSDLSTAMGSNEPATMSELIRKSRFEEKESKILSPKSKKNIAFILGSLLLLIVSIGIITSVFKKKEVVEFITEQKVDSLVYSNLDTGINTTGLESTRIKQAIRDVIEMEVPNDSINQIYYVEEDGIGNIRRLGIKDIFSKTDNETPEILYDNIENNFTHGVYNTDRNYPFVILKSLSYDRALEGLKEWEPTMIDDLATYMDLPPEATDRSLLEPGFDDDLIRNKNVRVARFLPREVDGRGILDLLKGNRNEPRDTGENSNDVLEPETNQGFQTIQSTEDQSVNENDPITFLDQAREIALSFFDTPVYAQATYSVSGNITDSSGPIPGVNISVTGSTIGGVTDFDGNYSIDNIPAGTQNLQYSYLGFNTQTRSVSADSSNVNLVLVENAEALDEIVITVPSNGNTTTQTSDVDSTWDFGNTTSGPRDTLSVDTTPVCFNQLTGDRVRTSTLADQQYGFCFKPYVCYRYTCYSGNNDLGPNAQGQPGAVCGEDRNSGSVLHKTDTGYNPAIDGTRQSCYQLTDVLAIQNISNAKLCFNEGTGQYLPGQIAEADGIVCSTAAQRADTMCIGANGVLEQPGQSQNQLCFQPFQSAVTGTINSTDSCADLTYDQLRQKVGAIAYELRVLTHYASLLGLSDQDVSNINQAAEFLESVSYGGIVESEAYNQAYDVVLSLEGVLDRIDRSRVMPLLGSTQAQSLYDYVSSLVYEMKCAFGVESTIGWVDVTIPAGETIFTGQTSPTVSAVQEALTIIGIMDSSSPRGTLDLVTQDAVAQFQTANGLQVTGIIDPATISVLNAIITGQATLFGENGTIENTFIITNGASSSNGEQILAMGAYNNYVQNLQTLLYAEGYPITSINGLFDTDTCSALQEFQEDQGLEISDSVECVPDAETLETLNEIILNNNYLGSGFYQNEQGFLAGTGSLNGTFGPGVVDFGVNEADADSLKEGDIVLMYMFLDEKTILIARDEIVIDEVVKRRALSDIFE